MLGDLKKEVFEANLQLKEKKLIIYTWGNVSGIDRENGLVVIKPSGIPYNELTPQKMAVVDLKGSIVEGELRPSSDTPTHLELYRNFSEIESVVHTHSRWATSWAQAKYDIPCYGTTHADYFYQAIPCTRSLTTEEIKEDYELNTGKVIIETFKKNDYLYTPAVLVAEHGPFTWGRNPEEAVHNSVVLEEVSRLAYNTINLNEKSTMISTFLQDKHFLRKHGKDAYYGQE